jgi:hypothetical protein
MGKSKSWTTLETHLNKLKHIVDVETSEEEISKYSKYEDMYEIVKDFITNKGLILYGGLALNEMLPEKYKFYPKYTLPDYDCYSTTARLHAIQLSKILIENGYKYVEVKTAMHPGTYKVYAEFQGVADITQTSKHFFKFLKGQTKDNPIHNQNDKNLIIAPACFLLWSLHKELARPKGSLYRWEKIYSRYISFHKAISLGKAEKFNLHKEVKLPEHVTKLIKIFQKYLKNREYPIVGQFAIGLYKGFNQKVVADCCRVYEHVPPFDVLSKDIYNTFDEIKSYLKTHDCKVHVKWYPKNRGSLDEIMPLRCRISCSFADDEQQYNMCRIFDVSDNCYSIKKLHGYTVGSPDTILQYLYAYYMTHLHFEIPNPSYDMIGYTKYLIIDFTKYITQNYKEPKDRFSVRCVGHERTKTDILRAEWERKKFVYRPEK